MNKTRLKKRSKLLEVARLNEPALNDLDNDEKPPNRGRQIKIITGYTPPSTSSESDSVNPFQSATESEITYYSDKKTISMTEAKTTRIDNLFKHFQELRREGRLTNMTLIVEGQSIHVHRTLLAASSKYFNKILCRIADQKDYDYRNTVVHEMKGVDYASVNLCLDFIYSACLNLKVETLEGMLKTAQVMQVKDLVKACFRYIELSVKNPAHSVILANISAKFPNGSTEKLVKNYIQKHFEDLMFTEAFFKLSEADLYAYVVEYSPNEDEALRAVMGWINHNGEERRESIVNLVKVFTFDRFPSDYFIKEILTESLIANSAPCQAFLANCILADVKKLEEGLTVGNCFNLKQMAKKHKDKFDESDKAIVVFMIDHFDQISVKDEFVSMTKDEVMMLFETSDDECFASEKFKWFAALRWIRHDQEREVVFSSILNTVKFYKLPKAFVKEIVMHEPLVKSSQECIKIVTDSVLTSTSEGNKYISVLIPNNEISAFSLLNKTWCSVPGIGELEKSEIFSLNNKLCLLTPKMIFHLGRGDQWIGRTEVDDVWLTSYYQVATTDDRMYFVGKQQLSLYDVVKDLWTCDLLGCGIDGGFCVTSLGEFVYAFGEEEAKKYHMLKGVWMDISHPGEDVSNLSAVAFNCHILIMSSKNGKCYRYDPVSDNWSMAMNPTVPDATELRAFVSSDKLLMLCKVFDTVSLYIYEEWCDTWMKMVDVPITIRKTSLKSSENGLSKSESMQSNFIPSPSTAISPFANKSDTNNNNSPTFKSSAKNSHKLTNDLFVSLPNTINGFIPPSNKNGRRTTMMSACMFEKVVP